MKRKLIPLLAFLVFVFVGGCITKNIHIADPRTLSPKDLGTVAMDLYEVQYKYHQKKAELSDLSEIEKQELRELKDLLVHMKPLIDTYIGLVDNNMEIDEDLRLEIVIFVERFLYGRH